MSSIRPCVFMSAPSRKLFFQLSFSIRAERMALLNLPIVETRMSPKQTSHISAESISPISVRRPVETKKSGRKMMSETSSTFSVMILRKRMFSGMTSPATKAPKRAWRPAISVR